MVFTPIDKGTLAPSTTTGSRTQVAVHLPPTINPSIPGSDFVLMTKPAKVAITLVYGKGGTGKTTFVVQYAPQPVAVLCFDRRGDKAIARALKAGRKVHAANIAMPPKSVDKSNHRLVAQECVDRVYRNVEVAAEQCRLGNMRTLCLDTVTELAKIVDDSYDDSSKGARAWGKDKDYTNQRFWDWANMCRDAGLNLVFTARSKEIWEKNEKTGKNESTGRFEHRCPEVCYDAADWAGHITSIEESILLPNMTVGKRAAYLIEIVKPGGNGDELGKVYNCRELEPFGGPFAYISHAQYYDTTTLDDWR